MKNVCGIIGSVAIALCAATSSAIAATNTPGNVASPFGTQCKDGKGTITLCAPGQSGPEATVTAKVTYNQGLQNADGQYSSQGDANNAAAQLSSYVETVVQSWLYKQGEAKHGSFSRELELTGAAVAKPPTWKYHVDAEINSVVTKTQGLAYSIDLNLTVADESGKVRLIRPYFSPPMKDRYDPKKAERNAKGAAFVGKIFSGIVDSIGQNTQAQAPVIGDTMQELGKTLEQMTADQLQNVINTNYVLSNAPPAQVPAYRVAEGLVRAALEESMKQMPLPTIGAAHKIPFKLRKPKVTGEVGREHLLGQAALERGDLDDAIERWMKLPQDDPDVQFNLGVARMALASNVIATDPERAYAYLAQAAPGLEAALDKGASKDKAIAQAPSMLMSEIEKALGRELDAPVSVTPESASSGIQTPVAVPAAGAPGSKHAILVGVEKFLYKDGIPQVPGAVKDVDNLAKALGACGFPQDNIKVLKNENATLQNIHLAIEQLAAKLHPDDLVVISFSTHGVLESHLAGGEGFIICYDTVYVKNSPPEVFATSLPILDLRQKLDRRLKCRQKILFQDTCHSGAGAMTLSSGRLQFTSVPQYMAIFNAAQEQEKSWGDKTVGGAFSYVVSQQLQKSKGKTSLLELSKQLEEHVPPLAAKIASKGGSSEKQTPNVRFGAGAEELRLN